MKAKHLAGLYIAVNVGADVAHVLRRCFNSSKCRNEFEFFDDVLFTDIGCDKPVQEDLRFFLRCGILVDDQVRRYPYVQLVI
ncbi:hypothetical protein D3C78_1889160 [compost metagenome]